ncbi:MAG: phosphoketolase [Segniliparus sp.]|uniref:phosphoketolase n=1 Tax=Segniliparus sp. TaxID=2804064 RepID=UPI003F34E662
MTEPQFQDLDGVETAVSQLAQSPIPVDESAFEHETRLLEQAHERLLDVMRDEDA